MELRVWNKSGVGVVKLYCDEFFLRILDLLVVTIQRQQITTFLLALRKVIPCQTFILGTIVGEKGANFLDHPQFAPPKGRSIIWIAFKHHKINSTSLEILVRVNNIVEGNKLPFVMVGNLDVKSFWFQVRCTYYGDNL